MARRRWFDAILFRFSLVAAEDQRHAVHTQRNDQDKTHLRDSDEMCDIPSSFLYDSRNAVGIDAASVSDMSTGKCAKYSTPSTRKSIMSSKSVGAQSSTKHNNDHGKRRAARTR